MSRVLFFVYGMVCYVLFFVVYAWLAGFVGNLVVPKTIDGPVGSESALAAAAINVLLLLVFAAQHSVMARGWLTVYMALAALVEERDLIAAFGEKYEDYRRRVPMFVPGWICRQADSTQTRPASAARNVTESSASISWMEDETWR